MPNPCLNGGSCSEPDGVAVCECPAGFEGEFCDPCRPNPCSNGTCSVGEVGGFSCECDTGWSGVHCTDPDCGDGVVDPGEECDDGNDYDGDGCRACLRATCRDGVVWEGIEECDDGNDNDNDGCLNDCTRAACGDGVVWGGHEDCDDGNGSDDDACLSDCTHAACGDGHVWEDVEDCDSPFSLECTGNCRFHWCGDGILWTGEEECDDGNDDNDDGCVDACMLATCGDGYVRGGIEDCEGTDLDSDLNGATCESLGQQPGDLFCGIGCVFDTLGCGVWPGMVVVPGGQFEMGSSLEADEEPIRWVHVDTFWMDQTEVTRAMYQQCVDAGQCSPPLFPWHENHCNWWDEADDHPVNCVTWNQAQSYCSWADKRLPTEAEWEKAARGIDGQPFPWGNLPSPNCDYLVMSNGWPGCAEEPHDIVTVEVGSRPLGDSPYGAKDMAGNVSEWVADIYAPYEPQDTHNPSGPPSEGGQMVLHVMRGGSWNDPDGFHVSNRTINSNEAIYDQGFDWVGFRCAKTPPGSM